MDVEVVADLIVAGDDAARLEALEGYHSVEDEARQRLLDRLAADAAQGNSEPLRVLIEIIDRYRLDRPAIRRVLVRDDEVEEAHQDVLVAVAQSITSFRGEASFRTWLFSVARNTAASNLRRSERTPTPVESVDQPMTGQRLSSMIAARTDLQAAVDALPDHYRDVVVLRDVEQWTYERISSHLGIPMNTVKSRINRGRALVATAVAEAS